MTAETLSTRMAKADAEVGAAELELRQAALAAGVAPDDDPQPQRRAEEARERLHRARERRELLSLAAEEADKLEAQKKAQAAADLRRSQNRAIRTHIGLLAKHAGAYQDATASGVAAFDRMLNTAETIRRLLPSDADHSFVAALSYGALRDACLAEINRVGAQHPISGKSSAPGARYQLFAPNPALAPPLTDGLRAKLMGCYAYLIGEATAQPKAAVEIAAPVEPAPVEPDTVEAPPLYPPKVTLDVAQVATRPADTVEPVVADTVEPVVADAVETEIRDLAAQLGIDAEAVLAGEVDPGSPMTATPPPAPPSAATSLFGVQ